MIFADFEDQILDGCRPPGETYLASTCMGRGVIHGREDVRNDRNYYVYLTCRESIEVPGINQLRPSAPRAPPDARI